MGTHQPLAGPDHPSCTQSGKAQVNFLNETYMYHPFVITTCLVHNGDSGVNYSVN